MVNLEGNNKKSIRNNCRFSATHQGIIFLLMVFLFMNFTIAQKPDSLGLIDHFSGNVRVTNNGISNIPSFSLGVPAILINLKAGMRRFSIEPEIRFSLKGKPWGFLPRFRYKAIQHDKFSLIVSAYPVLNFRTISAISNGVEKEVIETRRFASMEVIPRYALAKNISLSMFYLYSYGFDDGDKTLHFLTFNSAFTNIKFSEKLFMGINPQVFYVRSDEREGYYASATVSLAKQNFPISLRALVNQEIESEFTETNAFTWSVSLVYDF